MERRWSKLEKDFLNKAGLFDISKVPDIYDCIKYDLQHNKDILQCDQAEELYTYAKNMADVVVPQVNSASLYSKQFLLVGIFSRKFRYFLRKFLQYFSYGIILTEEMETVANIFVPHNFTNFPPILLFFSRNTE